MQAFYQPTLKNDAQMKLLRRIRYSTPAARLSSSSGKRKQSLMKFCAEIHTIVLRFWNQLAWN